MTTTANIAALIRSFTDLRDYFAGIRASIDQRVADLSNAANDLPAALVTTAYVDQENGNDANDGSRDAPFATLEKAVSLCNAHGHLNIYLLNNYIGDARRWVVPPGSTVFLQTENGVKYRLELTMQPSNVVEGVQQFELSGFYCSSVAASATLQIKDVHVVWPSEELVHPVWSHHYNALLGSNFAAGPVLMCLEVLGCTLEMPAGGEGYVLGSLSRNVALRVIGTQLIGDFSGRWVSEVPAGTRAVDAPNVLTHLSTL